MPSPYGVEQTVRDRSRHLFTFYLKKTHFLVAKFKSHANLIVRKMLFLESRNTPRERYFSYINSPGGSVTAGNGIMILELH